MNPAQHVAPWLMSAKVRYSILSSVGLLAFLFSNIASAAHLAIAVPLPTTLDQLVEANGSNKAGTYIPFDGLAFSSFTYSWSGDMPSPAQIDIKSTPAGQLEFTGPFLDLPGGPGNGASDATIVFDAEFNPAGGSFIGVGLEGNPSLGTGSGVATVTETILNTGLAEAIQLDIHPGSLTDSQMFSAGVTSMNVVKDILLLTSDDTEAATLSVIRQDFLVVPEPSGLALVLLGCVGFFATRRRNR